MWSTGEGIGKPLQYSCREPHEQYEKAKRYDTCQGTFDFKESYMLFSVSQGPSVPYQFLENRNEQSCTQFSGEVMRQNAYMDSFQ